MIDIIIPVYNEESILLSQKDKFLTLKERARLIFVDGGSQDNTVNIAAQYGEVINAEKGRGIQKNKGAEYAKNNFLLFLHVDTFINPESLSAIEAALKNGADAGCMTLKINERGMIFRIFEWVVNRRAKYRYILDGDLGLFVNKEFLFRMGGFPPYQVMEDVLFSRKFTHKDKIIILPEVIQVSSRKWHEKGFLKTFFRYTIMYFHLWTNFWFYKGIKIREEA